MYSGSFDCGVRYRKRGYTGLEVTLSVCFGTPDTRYRDELAQQAILHVGNVFGISFWSSLVGVSLSPSFAN